MWVETLSFFQRYSGCCDRDGASQGRDPVGPQMAAPAGARAGQPDKAGERGSAAGLGKARRATAGSGSAPPQLPVCRRSWARAARGPHVAPDHLPRHRAQVLPAGDLRGRSAAREPGISGRHPASLRPPGCWSDLIAVDAAYSRPVKTYLRRTKQDRGPESSLDRQIKGGTADAGAPRGSGPRGGPPQGERAPPGLRQLPADGRVAGWATAPNRYTVPPPGRGVIAIPCQFFLRGWIQVLYPSEIATWLTLRFLPHCSAQSRRVRCLPVRADPRGKLSPAP